MEEYPEKNYKLGAIQGQTLSPEFIPRFFMVLVSLNLQFYVLCFCRLLSLVCYLLANVLSVLLQFMASDYPFGILKLLYSQGVVSSTLEHERDRTQNFSSDMLHR